jgi:hypothetical protein
MVCIGETMTRFGNYLTVYTFEGVKWDKTT